MAKTETTEPVYEVELTSVGSGFYRWQLFCDGKAITNGIAIGPRGAAIREATRTARTHKLSPPGKVERVRLELDD